MKLSFLLCLSLAFIGCVNLKSYSCRTSDTPASVTDADITTPPAGTQTYLTETYVPAKYLSVETEGVRMHVFGSSTVSNWMMVQTHSMAKNIVASIASADQRAKFEGHQFLVITDSDPEIPGARPGQRNTGDVGITVINEVLVCATAVDTIRPDNAAEYRAWDTPIHEFGHSVERTLGLKPITMSLEEQVNPNYDTSVSDEYFAWATQKWFDADLRGRCGFAAIDSFENSYLYSVYETSQIWKPTCAGRP